MSRLVRLWTGAFLLLLAGGLCGCRTAEFYGQGIRGQYQVLKQRGPIAELAHDPSVRPELKEKFKLVTRLRVFARDELKLPIGEHYLTYADLGRRFAVWNVHAAPEFSLEPKKWWYPVVGSLKYRGYFSEAKARSYAESLARKGHDVYVEGVEAYSTLGWFADPLLNTFIHHAEPDLAEIIFHELGHQKLFVSGDTDFNEAFATAVAEEGVQRWYLARGDEPGHRQYLRALARNREFVALIMNARQQLQRLYDNAQGNKPGSAVQSTAALAKLRQEKAEIIKALREDYASLKASWGGYSGYDTWLERPLNNAQLNTIAVYYQLVPGFQALLKRHQGDLEAFYKSVRAMKKLGKDGRRARLLTLAADQAN